MIVVILIVLLVISFLWAIVALKKEERAHANEVHAKKELQKEKILFKS